jgi:hypothetical protein
LRKVLFAGFISMAVLMVFYGCGEDSVGEENGDDNGGIRPSILSPADVLPDEDDISNWKNLTPCEEANDYDGLYDLIDGAAEVYIDNGFVSAAFQVYNHCVDDVCDFRVVHVRVYDQGSADDARAVYDKISTGIGIPWDGAGTEARIDESALAAYTVEFWQRNFFVQIIIEEKTDEGLSVVKLFAAHISEEIG